MVTLKIDKLLHRQSQLQARIETLQAKETLQKRKDETRRKILIGSYLLDRHERAGTMKTLMSELDGFLFRKTDRVLFGLPPREDEEQP